VAAVFPWDGYSACCTVKVHDAVHLSSPAAWFPHSARVCARAALGALLQARGFKVRLRKLDPYLNVDPGTMSPYQHGEVFVTDDGAETDLDLGHYERYVGVAARKSDSVTTGRIYSTVIARERRGEYLGATVQVIPHVTDAIKEFITADLSDEDFVLCEIGGTVGDIESLPFLEAIRQLGNELGRERVCFVHLTLVPWIASAGELKTKPTQHSAKELLGLGIQPDILLCRCERPIPDGAAQENRAVLQPSRVARHPGHRCRYDLRRSRVLPCGGLRPRGLRPFRASGARARSLALEFDRRPHPPARGRGQYRHRRQVHASPDSYKSLAEAMTHGGIANNVRVKLDWINSEVFETESEAVQQLEGVHAILVPGGFGERGSEARLRRRVSPASATCPISASASGCRWRSSRQRGIWRDCPAPARPSSAPARTRSSD
jgi:CTP synthase